MIVTEQYCNQYIGLHLLLSDVICHYYLLSDTQVELGRDEESTIR